MRARSSCIGTPISRIFNYNRYERNTIKNTRTATLQGGVAGKRASTEALLNLDKRSLLGSMYKHCNGTNWEATRTLPLMPSIGTNSVYASRTMRLLRIFVVRPRRSERLLPA
jgi:hypothetical protein